MSLDRDDLAVLRHRAREAHGGNLSAAFAEAARSIRQRAARAKLVGVLGGPTLTASSIAALEAEQQGRPSAARRPARPPGQRREAARRREAA